MRKNTQLKQSGSLEKYGYESCELVGPLLIEAYSLNIDVKYVIETEQGNYAYTNRGKIQQIAAKTTKILYVNTTSPVSQVPKPGKRVLPKQQTKYSHNLKFK